MKNTSEDIREWFREQPNSRLVVAALIIIGIVYVIFGYGHGPEYHEQVNRELEQAIQICENSREWVLSNPNRLKLGKAVLNHVKVNGRTTQFEHVKYPQVLFLDSGFRNIDGSKTAQDIFCAFKDPRDSSAKFYYNYKTRQWVDKVRFHR